MNSLGIVDLLKICGFDPNCRSKIVRHKDMRYSVSDLLHMEWLEYY